MTMMIWMILIVIILSMSYVMCAMCDQQLSWLRRLCKQLLWHRTVVPCKACDMMGGTEQEKPPAMKY